LIDVVVEGSEKKGLDINQKMSFVMVFSKNATRPMCHIMMKDVSLEQVDRFGYVPPAVVLTCSKGDSQIQYGKPPNLAPHSSETSLQISIKFETGDYIGHATPCTKFVFLYVQRGRVPI